MKGPLYTTELLRLASSLSDPHPLEREDGHCELRSPTCGSRIRMAVQLDRDRCIQDLSIDVHACAFGQASAALLEKHSRGRTSGEIADALLRLGGWLAGESEIAAWPGIEILEPARSKNARHAAILLPFRALLAAIEAAP